MLNTLWFATAFLPPQKQLCSQRPVSVHISLNDNDELLTPPFSFMGGVDTRRKVLPWQPALVDSIQMAEGRNMLI